MLSENVPEELVRHILEGRCVAFVGAGFSAAAVRSWPGLLLEIAAGHPSDEAAAARALLEEKIDSRTLEMAAELLKDALTPDVFNASLRQALSNKKSTAMDTRVALLRGIPFRAILTTNFDPFLSGTTPSPAIYEKVLRPTRHRWWDEAYWDKDRPGPPVVKLHGDVTAANPDIVLGTRDYRRRIYANAGYTSFLRAVFATNTVLYLGFSFTDAYLHELHQEVLALLGHNESHAPVAYALMSNVAAPMKRHLRRHEGLDVLTYTSRDGDHGGFDRWLEAIHDHTSPKRHLGRLLSGRRIVWVDATPKNNVFARTFLFDAAGDDCVRAVTTWRESLPLIREGADLVLTHWGNNLESDQGRPCSVAERLLREMRREGLEAPVLVFASADHEADNRRRAMRLGALNYVYTWSDLFSEMARILGAQVAVR